LAETPTQTRVHKPAHSKHTTHKSKNKNNYINNKNYFAEIIEINATPRVLKYNMEFNRSLETSANSLLSGGGNLI